MFDELYEYILIPNILFVWLLDAASTQVNK